MVKTREANYFDVGVQGRKTGITLKQGQRDEFGLELIDGIFSPVASAPSKSGNDVIGDAPVRVERGPAATSVLADRRLTANNNNNITPSRSSNSLIPPPRSRSPIKTNLNSPPRRPPSSPAKSGPRSPTYQGLNGTPRRGIPHPSPAAKKKLNHGENIVRPIVRSSNTVVRRVSPRRFQSTPLKKDSPRKDAIAGGRRDENESGTRYQTSPRFSDAMVDEGDHGDERENGNNRGHVEGVVGIGGGMVNSLQPPTRNPTRRSVEEMDDMDDSMQLVQYVDDRFEQDNQMSTNDYPPNPGNMLYGQDDPESDKDYMPTPGATQFRSAMNRPQTNPHQRSESPLQATTTLAMKRSRGRPPKARTLVYQDYRDSDLEDEQGRPRKVIRNDQDGYLSSSGGNAFSQPFSPLGDPTTRLPLNDGGLSVTPQKRGPGRPRKIRFDGSTPVMGGSSSQTIHGDSMDSSGQVAKRGRGRPRKSESLSNNNPLPETGQVDPRGNGGARENTVMDEEWSNGVRWTRIDRPHQDLNQRVDRHPESIDPVLLADTQRREILTDGITQQRGSSLIPTTDQPPPHPQLPTTTTTEDPPPPQPAKRGRGRPKGSKNKPKQGTSQPFQSSTRSDVLEPWEEDPGIITGAVRLWDSELESSLDYLVEEEIAYSSKALSTFSSVANGSFRFAKALTLDFFGVGYVEIPVGGMKSARNARKMHMAFGVIRGKVLVECAGTKFRIGEEGMWHVPRGNVYSIKNDGDRPAKLFFAQGCEMRSRVGIGEGLGAEPDEDGRGRVGGGRGREVD